MSRSVGDAAHGSPEIAQVVAGVADAATQTTDGAVEAQQAAEHYFQAQKFSGTRHADLARRTAIPLRAAEVGRDRSRPLRRDRERVKDDVMRRAVTAKFTAHADICAILLGRGQRRQH